MMIAAFAKAGAVFKNSDYLNAAKSSWDFIQNQLIHKGQLLHRFRCDEADIKAFADDYIYLAWAALELYNATFEPEYLEKSVDLVHQAIEHCWDAELGGFTLLKTSLIRL